MCRHTDDSLLVFTALLFTAGADLFLLVIGRWYTAGLLLFCVVQILYGIRLRNWKQKPSQPEWLLRILLPVPCFLFLYVLNGLTLLSAAASFYGVNLIFNAVKSISFAADGLSERLFCIGLWLFYAVISVLPSIIRASEYTRCSISPTSGCGSLSASHRS